MAKSGKRTAGVVLGIDVGGSGIKGALVDTRSGEMLGNRHRIDTPQPATPKAVAGAVAAIASHFKWKGRLGSTMPARVRNGTVETAANIDPAWIGVDAAKLFEQETGLSTNVVNDADAAGVAEMRFGAGQDQLGTVLMLTLGTGIGSALFRDSRLIPNTEFGHLELDGLILEHRASNAVRKRDELPWEQWAERVQEVLEHVEFILAPDLIIVGGGVCRPKRWANFGHLLHTTCPLIPALLQNEAGLIGAAWSARKS